MFEGSLHTISLMTKSTVRYSSDRVGTSTCNGVCGLGRMSLER